MAACAILCSSAAPTCSTHCLLQRLQWLCLQSSNLQLNCTSELCLPAASNAGWLPFSHGQLRGPNKLPSEFRLPVKAKPNFSATPGHTTMPSDVTWLSIGYPARHWLLFSLFLHPARGCPSPFLSFGWIWCCRVICTSCTSPLYFCFQTSPSDTISSSVRPHSSTASPKNWGNNNRSSLSL